MLFVIASVKVLSRIADGCKTQIQARYDTHRTTRAKQQKEKLLAADFPGVTVDNILKRIEDPTDETGFEDPRHCLVFWARPPQKLKNLIAEIQKRLKAVSPSKCPHRTFCRCRVARVVEAEDLKESKKDMTPWN